MTIIVTPKENLDHKQFAFCNWIGIGRKSWGWGFGFSLVEEEDMFYESLEIERKQYPPLPLFSFLSLMFVDRIFL